MRLIFQLAVMLRPITLHHLPLLPWWGWLLVMAAQWALVIWLVPMPWWAYMLSGLLTAAYLFLSLIVWIFETSSVQ